MLKIRSNEDVPKKFLALEKTVKHMPEDIHLLMTDSILNNVT